MSAYKQIHNLDASVLSDVDEDNFDKAFDFFRPIIQGSAEFGKSLSKDEVESTYVACNTPSVGFLPDALVIIIVSTSVATSSVTFNPTMSSLCRTR
jgi:hypothetical protein